MRMGNLVCRFNPWIISFVIIWEVEKHSIEETKMEPTHRNSLFNLQRYVLSFDHWRLFLDCFQLFVLTLFFQIIWNFLQQLFYHSDTKAPIQIQSIFALLGWEWATIFGLLPNGRHANHKSWFGLGHNFGLLPNGHQHDAQELGERVPSLVGHTQQVHVI